MIPSTALVACNIYVTAAASQSSTLLSLLRRAQDRCRELRQDDAHITCTSRNASSENETVAPVAIIHAYADVPYDRSSFHLAGTPDCVSDVATGLIFNALKEIELDRNSGDTNNTSGGGGNESRHPFVGLIDHVSVMPLMQQIRDVPKCDAAANAARQIGEQISETKLVNVHYYGKASPNNTPLATVRRERTSFFNSGGAVDTENGHASETSRAPKGDTTIGTPDNFVENLNIRLTSNVSFDQAKTLTQYLRGRNISTKGYGVAGVEALTLPYVRNRSKVYEVACNLTKPKEGGVNEIRAQLEKWIEMQNQGLSREGDDSGSNAFAYFVEDAYRVGTTVEQCMEVLSGRRFDTQSGASTGNEMLWEDYDNVVLRNFQKFLQH